MTTLLFDRSLIFAEFATKPPAILAPPLASMAPPVVTIPANDAPPCS